MREACAHALPSRAPPAPKPRELEPLSSPTSTSGTSETSACVASPALSCVSSESAALNGGRKSSAGSSDLGELAAAAVGQLPASPPAATMATKDANVPRLDLQAALSTPSPVADADADADADDSLAFEAAPSSRHPSGQQRYLEGYLQHRVPLAGGLLQSWKRKFFRLRDRGLVCFRASDASAPLFHVHFTVHSLLVLDKLHADARAAGGGASTGRTSPPRGETLQSPKLLEKRASWGAEPPAVASLTLVLKHVAVTGQQPPAASVELPVHLKAESMESFLAWVSCLRGKMAARKRVLEQLQVGTLLAEAPDDGDTATSPPPGRGQGDVTLARKSPRRRRSSGVSAVMQEPPELHESPSPRAEASPSSPVQAQDYEAFRARYRLLQEIGEGSFSIVHRAVNRLTGRLCAVKCCKPSPALEEEVRLLRSLAHPNVVGLEGVFTHDSQLQYLVLDYLKHGDLCDLLLERQRLPEPEACRMIRQVAQGLAYLHRHGVLHRDLKPENILLHGRVVKIADLGLAKQLPHAAAKLTRSCGTLEYAAPELLCGQPYGLKADVFSLGVVLYVLLFGAFPFTVDSAAALQGMDRFPSARDVRDMSCLSPSSAQWHAVSPMAQDVLLRMLARDDEDRISADELLAHPWFDLVKDDGSVDGEGSRPQEDPEQARIEECEAMGVAELLARGLHVVKYGFKQATTPHPTALGLDFVHNCLTWTARRSPMLSRSSSSSSNGAASATSTAKKHARAISLNDITEIREGHATDAFRALPPKGAASLPPPELCLSIVCSWRTLDLVVEVASQREFLARGLRRLLPSS